MGRPRPLPTSHDLPIGVDADATWTEHSLHLEPGDTVVTVSDGVLDFFTSAEEVLDAARTVVVGTDTAQEVIDAILHYARVRGAQDDVTALVIRRLR